MSTDGPRFSHAHLFLNPDGLPRGLRIDGHDIPNVKSARVVAIPGDVTTVVVEIFVSLVSTTTVPE